MASTRGDYGRGDGKGLRKWQKLPMMGPRLGILFQVNNSKILSRLGLPDTRECLE